MKKLFKPIVSITAGVFSFFQVQAQAPKLVSLIPPSPNVQAFQKYGDIPVSAYTGIPNISIPLYTIKWRDISVPISLSYHASGIKVSEEASQVGLGWVINSGGTISRNIAGNDDLEGWAYFNSSSNTLPDFTMNQGPRDLVTYGWDLPMFNRNNPSFPTLYALNLMDTLSAVPPYDFQPDQYYYNFPGHDGKFIMTRAGQALIQKQEKIAISLISGTNYTWKIVSTDGFTYDFTTFETYHDASDHISAWYLTKITSPNGNSVTYNYNNSASRYVTTAGSYSDSWDYADPPVPLPAESPGFLVGQNTGRQQGQVPGRNYTLVVLDNIDFNDGVVKFNYSDNREDLPGDKRLDSLTVFSKDINGNLSAQPLKTIKMTYDYFNNGGGDNDDDMGIGNGTTPYAFERLRLLQVQQKGNLNGNIAVENPYTFTYNTAYSLPSKGSFARDHWGYYNGKSANTSLIPTLTAVGSPDPLVAALGVEGPERDAAPLYTGAYSLSGIQYPTGGTTEFQFENNDYDEGQSQVNDYSYFGQTFTAVPQQVTLNFDNQEARLVTPTDTLDLTNEYVYTADPLNPGGYATASLNVAIRFSGDVCGTNPFTQLGKLTFDIYDVHGSQLIHHDAAALSTCSGSATEGCYLTCSGYTPVFSVNWFNLHLGPGKYILQVHVDSSFTTLQDIHFTFDYFATASSVKSYGGTTTTFATGGGQRIVRIIDHPAGSTSVSNLRKYNYHYFSSKNGSNAEYSYGRRMSHPVYSSFLTTPEEVAHDFSGGPVTHFATGLHLMRSADSDNPLNGSAAGAVVGYDQVTELHGENGENGKTVFRYINSPDTIVGYNDLTYHLPMKPPYASNYPDFQNGSLLEQIDYVNNQGQFIKLTDVTNTYADRFDFNNMITGLDIRTVTTNHTEYGTDGPPSRSSTTAGPRLLIKYTAMSSQFPYLASTDEKVFDQADTTKFFETNTNYYYDNPNHLLPTRVATTNSKGELITTNNKYPLDYTVTGTATPVISQGIQNLQSKHVLTPVIEKYVQKSNADGTSLRTISSAFTSYKSASTLPDVIQATASVAPITGFAPATITASTATLDSHYLQYINFGQYDTYGNILQQQRINGINNGYIWDYNASFPIAEVKNAVQADIAYTSFEADGSGNWTIAPATWDNTTAFTGANSYNLSSGSVSKAGLTATTTYVVSYWTKSASPLTITGTISGYPLKGATSNGWTYYEHKVTGVTSVSLGGTGNIDEVRLYPQDAQMTSYTYTPLIGVTSVGDARGSVNYYEYDGLGRLVDIKDLNGNVIKSFVYHYAGQ